MKNHLLTIFSLFILGASIQPNQLSAQNDGKAVTYYLSEGLCYGQCCVYDLEIFIDGTATMEGKEHCDLRGRYAKTISNSTLSKIGKLFDAVNFEKLPDSYDSQLPDLPSVTIAIQKNGVRKKVTFKENRPDELKAIEEAMKAVAHSTEGWSPFKPERDVDNGIKESLSAAGAASSTATSIASDQKNSLMSDKEVKNEIIVTPSQGVDFHHWFESNSRILGLTKKRVWAPDSDRWVISFDPTKHSLQEVESNIRKDKSVTIVVLDK